MVRSRTASKGSFRSPELDVMVPAGSTGRSAWKTVQIATRDDPRLDPRRDPAYHNRMLFAAANR